MLNIPVISFILFFSLVIKAEISSQNVEANLKEINDSTTDACSRAYPSSCAELFLQGTETSGVYNIYPKPWFSKNPIKVYCDMDTDGGGWTVFQKRDNFESQENFFRKWCDYRRGFGNLEKDFWLGNDNLYILTNQDLVMLRIDLQDFEGNKRYAVYTEFQVSSLADEYRLKIGNYFGDAGDSLNFHRDMTFVTYDHNDKHKCSARFKGGWWYQNCHHANLNGMYLKGNHTSDANGVNWKEFSGYFYSLMKSEMKFRPVKFKNCDDAI